MGCFWSIFLRWFFTKRIFRFYDQSSHLESFSRATARPKGEKMDSKKSDVAIPEHVLDGLEDLSSDVLDLRDLMLAFAASASQLPDKLADNPQSQVH